MPKLRAPDIACGHCVRAIEEAVRSVDPAARVVVDLAEKIVTVETTASDQAISDAVRAAGYANDMLAA